MCGHPASHQQTLDRLRLDQWTSPAILVGSCERLRIAPLRAFSPTGLLTAMSPLRQALHSGGQMTENIKSSNPTSFSPVTADCAAKCRRDDSTARNQYCSSTTVATSFGSAKGNVPGSGVPVIAYALDVRKNDLHGRAIIAWALFQLIPIGSRNSTAIRRLRAILALEFDRSCQTTP
jgi:hypothetical protein